MAFGGYLVGVLLAVVASVISNLGLNLQKRNHLNNERDWLKKQATINGGTADPSSATYDGTHGTVNGTNGTKAAGSDESSTAAAAATRRSKVSKKRTSKRDLRAVNEDDEEAELSSPVTGGDDDDDDRDFRRRHSENHRHHDFDDDDMDTTHSSHHGRRVRISPHTHYRQINGVDDLPSQNGAYVKQPTTNMDGDSDSPPLSPTTGEEAEVARKKNMPKFNYSKQRMWQAGFICVILGSLFDFAALAFAPQMIVAPLGSLTLVSNIICAPLLLGETVARRDIIATIGIVAGSVISVAFATHEDSTFTNSALFELFLHTRFIVYFAVTTVFILLLRWGASNIDRIRLDGQPQAYLKLAKYHRFAWAAMSGIMGAQSVLFAKCSSQLLVNTFKGDILFVKWPSYLVLLGLFLTIYYQIKWLNSGLQLFTALYIVPVFQSFWILISVISGMVFFGEYKAMESDVTKLVMFPFGIFMTIAGVYYLSQRDPTAPEGSQPVAEPTRNSRVTDASAPLDKTPLLIKSSASPHLTPSTRTANNSLVEDSMVPRAGTGRMTLDHHARASIRKSPAQQQEARGDATSGRTRSRTDASDYLSQSARQRAVDGLANGGADDHEWAADDSHIRDGGAGRDGLLPPPLTSERSDSGSDVVSVEDLLSPRAAASEGIRQSFIGSSRRSRARSWSVAPSPQLVPQSLGRAIVGIKEGPSEMVAHTPIWPLAVTLQALFEGGAQAEAEAAVLHATTTPSHHSSRSSGGRHSRKTSRAVEHDAYDPSASVPNPDRQRRSGTSSNTTSQPSTPPKGMEHKRSPSAAAVLSHSHGLPSGASANAFPVSPSSATMSSSFTAGSTVPPVPPPPSSFSSSSSSSSSSASVSITVAPLVIAAPNVMSSPISSVINAPSISLTTPSVAITIAPSLPAAATATPTVVASSSTSSASSSTSST